MAKEEGPLEYQRRSRDAKSAAQRIDLEYLKRPALLGLLRRKITWIAIALSIAAGIPIVLGIAGSKKALLPGPIAPAHAMFQNRCEACHAQAFAAIPDTACKACHDGPPHPAKAIDTARIASSPRCADCHLEHRGAVTLAAVANGNCTGCHAALTAHASGVRLANRSITAFRAGGHPEFSALAMSDNRPLRLNHAIHMPAKPASIRGMKLPMQCEDCHRTDPNSPTGDLLPVTFEQNCRSCHARELEFDIYGVLETAATPAPHAKDPRAIHEFVLDAYRQALAADPQMVHRPLGNDIAPQPSASAWLDRVVRDSETFLFQRKCNYCHEYAGMSGTDPVIRKVNAIRGHFAPGQPAGEPWLPRGEFSHRAHRAVTCESCHSAARTSTKTADVLIPAMKSCLPCHGQTTAALDRCSTCHRYHNRGLEKENRRPTQQVLTGDAGGSFDLRAALPPPVPSGGNR